MKWHYGINLPLPIKIEFLSESKLNKKMGDAANDTSLVSVSIERLKRLEELENKLPSLIEEAIANHKKNILKKLHEQDKNNPEAVKNRVKKYLLKNKDKIKINGLSYLKNLKLENPEKIKEYNHNAYIKRKEKKNIVKEKIEQVSNSSIEQVTNSIIESSTVNEPISIIYTE